YSRHHLYLHSFPTRRSSDLSFFSPSSSSDDPCASVEHAAKTINSTAITLNLLNNFPILIPPCFLKLFYSERRSSITASNITPPLQFCCLITDPFNSLKQLSLTQIINPPICVLMILPLPLLKLFSLISI